MSCYCGYYTQVVCKNDHSMCPECIAKNNNCKYCDSEYELKNFSVPYIETNSKEDVFKILQNFILKWKTSNFLRVQKISFLSYIDDLFLLGSAKQNKKYKLYRCIRECPSKEKYIDKYISSWSLKPLPTFGKFMYYIEVGPENVFLDLNYLKNDCEKEVLIFQGSYECKFEVIEGRLILPKLPKLIKEIPTIEELKKIFIIENKDKIDKERKNNSHFYFTIPDLLNICEFIQIKIKKSSRKIEIINIIIQTLNEKSLVQ